MEGFVWGCFGFFLKQKLILVDNKGILPYLNLSKSFKTPKLTLLEKWEHLILLHKTILLATTIALL